MKPGTDGPLLFSEDPFLVYREPPYWRWMSFAEAGHRLARWRASLVDLAPGSRVRIPSSPLQEELLADLAVRSCGLVAVPVPAIADKRLLPEPADADVLLDFASSSSTGPDPAVGESIEHRKMGDPGQRTSQPTDRLLGGCVAAIARGAEERVEQVAGADLAALVDRLVRAWLATGGDSARRQIVLHGRSLMEWDERVVVEWAICVGAAVVVTSTPEDLAAAAFWVRPTVLHGSAEELATWSRLFRTGEVRDRGLRSRFRRLQRVVVCGEQPLEQEIALFYTHLGAEVVRLDEVENQL